MKRPIVILGMHRSGTSSLAGMLEAAGLHLGKVNTAAAYNKKGNRENAEVMALNDAVLANSGHTWRNVPTGPAVWTEADRVWRDAVIATLSASQPWGFKDPRALLTLDGWAERLPDAIYVGTFRHPKRVARSLAARPAPLHVPLAEGLELWRRYNERLVAWSSLNPMHLVDFDLPPEAYLKRVRAIAAAIGLDPDKVEVFFEETLRASDTDVAVDLTPDVSRLHATLVDLANQQFSAPANGH